MVFKGTISFVILTNKQGLVQQICPYLGLEVVMSIVINKYSTKGSYFTVSKGLIENQQKELCVIFT